MKPHLRMVMTLSVFVFLVMMGINLIAPILPLYALDFGASVLMVSALIAAFAVVRMLLDLPAGLLGSRFHPKSLMLFGLALISGSSVLCAFAPNFWVLLVGRIIEGAGSAFYTTMSTTLLAMSVPQESRGRYMSIFTAMLLLGAIAGPGAGGLIASALGLRAPFLFYALVTAIGFALVLLLIEKTNVPRAKERLELGDIREILKDRSVILVNIATFSLFFTRAGVTATLIPLFAYKSLRMTEAVLGGILTLTALATFATMTPSGTYTDRHGRRRSMTACLFLTGLLTAAIPFTTGTISFALVMTGYGLTLGLSGPMAAWIADLVPRERLPAAMGFFRTFNDAGFVAGPLVLGSVAELSGSGTIGTLPFATAAVYLAAVAAALSRARDPVRDGPSPAPVETIGQSLVR
ncbi:MAG: MFS transporter [Thermoplasmatota archaeon]